VLKSGKRLSGTQKLEILQGVQFTMSKSFILIFIMKRVVFSSAFYDLDLVLSFQKDYYCQ